MVSSNERRMRNMKRFHKLIRLLGLTLAISLLLGSGLGAGAADDQRYREKRFVPVLPAEPQWTQEEVDCRSGDNTLRGTLTVPKDREGKMPVAILLHGLNTDRNWCDDIAFYLAENGIASVRFDYAGNGESDGAQTDMSVSSELRDTLAILDYVKGLELTDPDNIFAVGKSMGAVEAVLAAKSRQGEIRALCLWYPGFGVADAARHGVLLGQTFFPFDPPETLEICGYTYGRTFIRECQALNMESACAACDLPVLILHGDADFVAPIQFSFQMENEFPDCELKVYPGAGHGFTGFQEFDALYTTLSFFQSQMRES